MTQQAKVIPAPTSSARKSNTAKVLPAPGYRATQAASQSAAHSQALAQARSFPQLFPQALDITKWLQFFLAHKEQLLQVMSLVGEWDSITQPITDHVGMKSRIIVALKFAKLAATLTPTDVDDSLVDTVTSFLNTSNTLDDLTDLILKVWPTPMTQAHVIDPERAFKPEHLDVLKSRFADRKIDWSKLLGLLPTIIQIIQIFGGVKLPLPTA